MQSDGENDTRYYSHAPTEANKADPKIHIKVISI